MSRVDEIVASLPPPDKLRKGGDPEPDPGDESGDDYSPEEDAAMAVAKALGVDTAKVDVPALCSALRDFNATASAPTEE